MEKSDGQKSLGASFGANVQKDSDRHKSTVLQRPPVFFFLH